MLSTKERIRKSTLLIAVLTVSAVIIPLSMFLYTSVRNNKVVGEIDGAKLNYNGRTYIESFDNVDRLVGSCIGSAVYLDTESKTKLYILRDNNNYIYTRSLHDYRLYELEGAD